MRPIRDILCLLLIHLLIVEYILTTITGLDGAVAKSSANVLVGTGFTSWYRVFKGPVGRCKANRTSSFSLTSNSVCVYIYIYHWRGKRVGKGGICPPPFLIGAQCYVCAPTPPPPHPPLLTPHFYFPLELYVYITLTNNYLAFFVYQLIILWTISIN